jgi:hypothetical protein
MWKVPRRAGLSEESHRPNSSAPRGEDAAMGPPVRHPQAQHQRLADRKKMAEHVPDARLAPENRAEVGARPLPLERHQRQGDPGPRGPQGLVHGLREEPVAQPEEAVPPRGSRVAGLRMGRGIHRQVKFMRQPGAIRPSNPSLPCRRSKSAARPRLPSPEAVSRRIEARAALGGSRVRAAAKPNVRSLARPCSISQVPRSSPPQRRILPGGARRHVRIAWNARSGPPKAA